MKADDKGKERSIERVNTEFFVDRGTDPILWKRYSLIIDQLNIPQEERIPHEKPCPDESYKSHCHA